MGPDLHSAAANASAASFAALESRIQYLDPTDIEGVRRAYRFADEAHLGQKRKNGEPYITHPIAVTAECALWKLDAQALMAALLHDTIEDCGVKKSDIVERFGAAVAELVDGLTKLDKLEFTTREENQAESFRKMLLAMARDVRVILIKIADRTHNMRTLGDVPREKWARTARETLDIYAPIAHRLGLNQSYRELQELSFQHAFPWRHAILSKALVKARKRRGDFIETVRQEAGEAFNAVPFGTQMMGREKTLYSIYRKMREKHLSFSQVTDMYGLRVVVPNVTDCYTALGVIHQLYKPVPGKFKDYIAIAKVNGYQSLHTTVVGPRGLAVEFQMRTEAMHLVAESGIAAHWLYKSSGAARPGQDTVLGTRWLQSLLDIQNETRDAAEFWDHVKIDLFPDAVYVFTPRSEIISLPRGATVLDFAYEIHSDVGDRSVRGRVNGAEASLRTVLKNGDVVEVVTEAEIQVSPTWLNQVRTGKARSKIRHHLKTIAQAESEDLGRRMLEQSLRAEGFDALPTSDDAHKQLWDRVLRFSGNRNLAELLTDIGQGRRLASIVAKRIVTLLAESGEKPDPITLSQNRFGETELTQASLALDGSEASTVAYAPCCHPVPGDAIDGYLGRGEGLTVHRHSCTVGQRLRSKDAERFIEVHWSDEPVRLFNAQVDLTVTNGKGVLATLAEALARHDADIVHVDMGGQAVDRTAQMRFLIGVRDAEHLAVVLRGLGRVASVLGARRV
jgi:GTP diphosphokinase / guanosine-3',5'-bis(diphosphate) 3'-diphosphatase